MPSKFPTEMMTPIPPTEEEIVQELPPEPVNENEIFSKKEVKKNTSSEKEIEKIEKQETKKELELLIVEQNEKPKKKKRGKSTKSPEELAAHMAKMRAASLKKRQEKKKQKDLLKKETIKVGMKSTQSLPETIPETIPDSLPKLEKIPVQKPEQPRITEKKLENPPISQQKSNTSNKHNISLEDKLRLTELKLFEYQIREDERNKIKGKNENKAKEIAKKNIQQPNRWGRKSAIAKWAQVPSYQTDDPYDVFKIK